MACIVVFYDSSFFFLGKLAVYLTIFFHAAFKLFAFLVRPAAAAEPRLFQWHNSILSFFHKQLKMLVDNQMTAAQFFTLIWTTPFP